MSYILVTPARNEENNLPKLIQSVVEQTIKPLVWVIVDDGSTDNSHSIIRNAQKIHKWIYSIRLKEGPRDLGKHVYHVYNIGFNIAINYCTIHNISFDYIGNIDADMILETEFFEKLIKEFEKNLRVGIASGSVYSNISNKLFLEENREDLPMGSLRLWRKECFEETGGYLISYSSDSVSNVLAKLKGWETRSFEGIRAVQTRRTSSAEGLWNGYKYHGKSCYFRNYHPLFVLAKGIKLTFEKPNYTGIAYLYGYLCAAIKRMDKIDDKEVGDYYYHQKYKEVVEYYKNKLRKK
ncbi:MAG: Glycosyl transferase family 2 [Candidatus Argoarchaeum ethanivorans]|uniref:Glycosyl transferase family 2 n=1 Tax=Candidatus Argoarchaeum ethanivorans TaxID=2608793 RepID=A0A811T908_9EURY|nr:MAG: Glycosyl transferase family 2 [Candidatus Argoarchaeum ethanivorans]